MKRSRLMRRILLNLFTRANRLDDPDPRIVKGLLPGSWFTKKGPGIEEDTRRAFYAMTAKQQLIAVRRGWVPWNWLSRKLRRELK